MRSPAAGGLFIDLGRSVGESTDTSTFATGPGNVRRIVALGHATTNTTETYYARRRVRDAFEELAQVWSPAQAQSPLIDQ